MEAAAVDEAHRLRFADAVLGLILIVRRYKASPRLSGSGIGDRGFMPALQFGQGWCRIQNGV